MHVRIVLKSKLSHKLASRESKTDKCKIAYGIIVYLHHPLLSFMAKISFNINNLLLIEDVCKDLVRTEAKRYKTTKLLEY